ncbi:MAG: amidase, partial [Rubrivivax sp.]|nr:amidase [Rubrivivax sp.]
MDTAAAAAATVARAGADRGGRRDEHPDPVTALDAISLSRAIHARQVSCREVMQAYLARIHRLNPAANAIVNLVDDEVALAEADRCDSEL